VAATGKGAALRQAVTRLDDGNRAKPRQWVADGMPG
jgi:hypothetical protein